MGAGTPRYYPSTILSRRQEVKKSTTRKTKNTISWLGRGRAARPWSYRPRYLCPAWLLLLHPTDTSGGRRARGQEGSRRAWAPRARAAILSRNRAGTHSPVPRMPQGPSSQSRSRVSGSRELYRGTLCPGLPRGRHRETQKAPPSGGPRRSYFPRFGLPLRPCRIRHGPGTRGGSLREISPGGRGRPGPRRLPQGRHP